MEYLQKIIVDGGVYDDLIVMKVGQTSLDLSQGEGEFSESVTIDYNTIPELITTLQTIHNQWKGSDEHE